MMHAIWWFIASLKQQLVKLPTFTLPMAYRRLFALLKGVFEVEYSRVLQSDVFLGVKGTVWEFTALLRRYLYARRMIIYVLCTFNLTMAYLLYADEVHAFFNVGTIDFQQARVVEGFGVVEEIELQEVAVLGELEILIDPRVQNIERILKKNNSPMAGLEWYIVQTADEYGVDPYLIVAIAGQESRFGKYSCGYNAWGYANCRVRFLSWQDGIRKEAELLSKAPYFVQETTTLSKLYAIGSVYAEDPHWPSRVSSFYNQLASLR